MSCVFYISEGACKALKEQQCIGCKFSKTAEEYKAGIEEAKALLARKRLRPCEKVVDGKTIMSVRKSYL